jgi:predicted phage terminase large subunit-like protein
MDIVKEKLYLEKLECEAARRYFYCYCQLKAPDFYNSDYTEKLCNTLQNFIDSDNDILIINMPPRAGKSRTIGNLIEWIFGRDKTIKVMTGSYNETLSTAFSKSVRDTIQKVKADPFIPVYSDIFPNVQIQKGDAAMNLWSLNGGYQNYLATSPGGTATGFGCQIMVLDDILKNAMEAYNENIKQAHWEWFTGTMLSRLEEGGKVIIVMTRWATNDLTGRALKHFGELGLKIIHVVMKAKNEDGTMLCDDVLSEKSYEIKRKTMPRDIFEANYQQTPVDIKGRLYTKIKTYEDVPRDASGNPLFKRICNYTDTADEGSDYLCSIVYGEYNQEAYILDLLYTKDAMEKTEPATAKLLYDNGVNIADIESNNGGKGFARSVKRILNEEYKSNKCSVRWFHQSANKVARILSNSTWVMEHIYFPVNWQERWADFAEHILNYQREGKNAHDDAEDALTGIAEKITEHKGMKFNAANLRM